MPKVVGIMSQKGGAGKTTTSVHITLAAVRAGLKVLLVDMDPQRSSTNWFARRQENLNYDLTEIMLADITQANLGQALAAADAAGVDLVVLDTEPRISAKYLDVARASDLILIPVQPSILDVEAVGATAEMVATAGKTDAAHFVLNRAGANRGFGVLDPDVAEAMSLLPQAYGIPVCPARIGDRKAFSRSLNDGRAVSEMKKAEVAAEEVAKLWAFVADRLGFDLTPAFNPNPVEA